MNMDPFAVAGQGGTPAAGVPRSVSTSTDLADSAEIEAQKRSKTQVGATKRVDLTGRPMPSAANQGALSRPRQPNPVVVWVSPSEMTDLERDA